MEERIYDILRIALVRILALEGRHLYTKRLCLVGVLLHLSDQFLHMDVRNVIGLGKLRAEVGLAAQGWSSNEDFDRLQVPHLAELFLHDGNVL